MDKQEQNPPKRRRMPSFGGSSYDHRLYVKNAAQIVRVATKGERVKTKKEMDNVEVLENGSMIIGLDGKIVAVGTAKELEDKYGSLSFENELDATGKCIVPGLCDGHTHPVWSGDRVHEFKMKLAGATYMEVHEAGGGIGFTVRHTKASSEDELEGLLMSRLDRMLRTGTTLIEAKSGYGLETETEIKMLKVLHKAGKSHVIDVVSNFCGAHSIPKGMTADEQTKDVIERQLPAVVKAKNEGLISPTMIDAFCESNIFTAEHTRRIMEAGAKVGLRGNFHGDELTQTHSGSLGAATACLAVSHCEWCDEQSIKDMAAKGVCGVLLPATVYVLKLDPPPARKMIDGGVPVALGTDFNPNCHIMSLPHTMNLACVILRMTMNEALVASTLNSAASMGKSDTHGSLEVGKAGDFLLLEADKWEHLIYQQIDPPIQQARSANRYLKTHVSNVFFQVYKEGSLAHTRL